MTLNPPKKVLELIHQIFVKFFWGNMGGIKEKNWVAWKELCFPKAEGDLGFRSLHDVNDALFAKLWWNFRVSTKSLCAKYVWNKYCKKFHPVMVASSGASQFDNWTRQGALYYTEGERA
ncbi:hypothetical protein RDI58_021654 [Solanum bulbocastanum]|uniref:Uncharacterized protein n=1 Tax=Solanum bulbocastanum TaxID=147425 RepID=A0AAN8Y4K1_SOLBU